MPPRIVMYVTYQMMSHAIKTHLLSQPVILAAVQRPLYRFFRSVFNAPNELAMDGPLEEVSKRSVYFVVVCCCMYLYFLLCARRNAVFPLRPAASCCILDSELSFRFSCLVAWWSCMQASKMFT